MMSSLDDLEKQLSKNWRYRFWKRVLAPRFWLEDLIIKHQSFLKRHFLGRLLLYVQWRWYDDIYCPFCGACGTDECCPVEMCNGGSFCPYKDEYKM